MINESINYIVWLLAKLTRKAERLCARISIKAERYVLKRKYPEHHQEIEARLNDIREMFKNPFPIKLDPK